MYRIEEDTMGQVRVPKNQYWGAQTQRSLENFQIGSEKIPEEVIRALAIVKRAAARASGPTEREFKKIWTNLLCSSQP